MKGKVSMVSVADANSLARTKFAADMLGLSLATSASRHIN